MRQRDIAPALVVAVALVSTVAAAEDGATAQSQEKRAKELFEKGALAYEEGLLADAIAYMQDSYLMAPKPVVVYNLAVVEIEAGRFVDAGNHLHVYLETEETISSERRLEITQTIEDQIRPHASLIQITGIEVGAEVLVDGTGIGAAGIRYGWWTAAGEHEVSIPGGESKGVTTIQGETVLVHLEKPPEKKSLLPGLVVGGVGIATAAVGGGLFIQAKKDADIVESAPPGTEWSQVDESYGRARSFTIAGAVLSGVGGLAIAAGTVILAVTAHKNKTLETKGGTGTTAWIAPIVAPGGGGMAVGGTF